MRPMCSWKDAIRVMLPWLALLSTSGCHDFSLPQRQAEPPQHQPGGFIESVSGAMAEGYTRLRQLLCCLRDTVQQSHLGGVG